MLLRVCLALCLAVTVAAEDVSHERGQSHTFECTFPISADRYILNWMKNDESVMNYFTGDPAPTFTGDLEDRAGVSLVNRRNLEIQNLRISDEGEYYCSVSELGEGGQSGDGMRYQLVVYVPPTISVSGGPYEAEVGGKMMVTCRANSHPPSNFTWTSPLGEISHGAVLELTNMTTNDIGRYMCMANNGYGVASAYVDISMKGYAAPSMTTESGYAAPPMTTESERVVGGSDVMRATGLPIMLLLIASLLLPVFFS
ncbi:PREDICTED: hemicentin-1-like isoform X1 [Branchiostoma belcheri]|uniref:Hemicentin-1-like isoform X1 n=1 Tax=Branchiostoma belcheri TaxID=7741 RepID=A0A6P4YMJ6_BRABE|nr:PREDICTED: hemicentin-1-like isoform X1 [Branchiostoma belcheri]